MGTASVTHQIVINIANPAVYQPTRLRFAGADELIKKTKNNIPNIKMFRLLIVLNYDFADSRFLFSAACQSLGKNLETIKKLMADGINIKKVTVMASLIDSKSL